MSYAVWSTILKVFEWNQCEILIKSSARELKCAPYHLYYQSVIPNLGVRTPCACAPGAFYCISIIVLQNLY